LTAIAISGITPAPGGGTFSFLLDPVISGNTTAFQAGYSGGAGTVGIFASISGIIFPVIRQGDSLFGSTVTFLEFGSSGLDGSNIAFRYSLANNRSGIAVATLGPSNVLFVNGFEN